MSCGVFPYGDEDFGRFVDEVFGRFVDEVFGPARIGAPLPGRTRPTP
ncbi:hypothetical protein [Streptomyces canus]|nr:hypothetical protein [Streptomyces canus]MDQ0764929.1 hypothetical protein [Streptomyces canus]MDQ1066634.1 hypothetical protein [Streptomyces canus]